MISALVGFQGIAVYIPGSDVIARVDSRDMPQALRSEMRST